MGNFLNTVYRTGTTSLLRAVAGRFLQVVDNPGGSLLTTSSYKQNNYNVAAHMGGYIHVMNNEWRAVNAVITGSPPFTWQTLYTRNTTSSAAFTGFHPFLSSNGPGLVARVAGANSFGNSIPIYLRWFYNTPGVVQTTTSSGEVSRTLDSPPALVVGALFYANAARSSSGTGVFTKIFNIEDASITDVSGGSGSIVQSCLATINNNVYRVNGTTSGGSYTLQVILGGAWVDVITVPTITVPAFTLGAPQGIVGLWARGSLLYICAPATGGGAGLFEYDPGLGTITDVTNTLLDPLLRPGGGLNSTVSSLNWGFSNYYDLQTPLGDERCFIQLRFGLASSGAGIILFEHTGSGVTFVGNTEFNSEIHGSLNCPYYGNHVQWTDGNLWVLQTALPTPVQDGVQRTYRIGGDPGNADTKIRLYYDYPPGAPDNQATLEVPSGGLGQAGASLVEESPGVWVVEDWDADGTSTLSVIHKTIDDSIPAGDPTAWYASASKS